MACQYAGIEKSLPSCQLVPEFFIRCNHFPPEETTLQKTKEGREKYRAGVSSAWDNSPGAEPLQTGCAGTHRGRLGTFLNVAGQIYEGMSMEYGACESLLHLSYESNVNPTWHMDF